MTRIIADLPGGQDGRYSIADAGCGVPVAAHPASPPERELAASSHLTLVAGFEHWVDSTPAAPAVKHGARTCTYAELDRQANRIAHAILRSVWTGTVPIALVLETGITAVAAILGVLKAGKFYVVLDPAHPAARNQHVVADARPALVLTQAAHAETARLLAGSAPVLLLDEPDCGLSADRPNLPLSPDDPAWLIYTSGSTGKPKGVLQNHRNAVHNVRRQQSLAAWSPGDRMSWLYSPGVMGATRGLTAALLNGATLFPRDPRHDSPPEFLRWLADEQITVYHSVASLFRTLFSQAEPGVLLPDIRLVMFGGERVTADDVERVRRHFPRSCRIYTGLGTTETGTVLHHLVDPHAPPAGPALPLGRPVAGVAVRLLDERERPVPPGEAGEIQVISPYLSLGYRGRPELTAATFGPDGASGGARWYRTGDLGRWGPDGLLWHGGRRDFQVKIRGFRIEVAEIEFALQQHPAVREAVVIGRTDDRQETGLAAYCVSRDTIDPPLPEVRRFLLDRLPRHMVPAAIVFLPALPRTPNGKIDRRALPETAPLTPTRDAEFVPPATAIEERLAVIWGEVLGLARIGRHDDFFDLGGHSLNAMQVSARIRQAMGREISPRLLLEAPTLAALAGRLELAFEATDADPPEPLVTTDRAGPRPLSFAQERLWFLDQLEPDSNAYHIGRAFRLQGHPDLDALRAALETILARHEILRSVYADVDGTPVSRVQVPAEVPLRVVDLAADAAAAGSDAALRRFADAEAERPFNLGRDCLLRAALGRASATDAVLVLTMHHIASDAWSVALLLGEFSRAYAAARQGTVPELAPLKFQYSDFAAWQRRRLAGAAMERHLAFWREALAGAPPLLELPPDFPRSAAPGRRGTTLRVDFPPALRTGMRELAQCAGVTPFLAWLAAFQVLLFRHTGQTDLLVATPVAGRTHVELESLIGFFVNTVVFRAQLTGEPSFAELLTRLRRLAVDVFAHDELPFERVVLELRPKRHAEHPPLAQIMFAWQNSPRAHLLLPGLEVVALPLAPRAPKFDLLLEMESSDTGLSAVFEYNAHLYRPETIARLGAHLQELVAAALAHPGLPVSELSLLPPAEAKRLVQDWSVGTGILAEPGSTVLDGITRHVAGSPEAVAIRGGGRELTYAALGRQARAMAERLASLGVRPGSIVGVCLERRVELGPALLGILEAGAAFLPLDAAYPPARLEFMLSDSGAAVLIVSATTRERFATAGVTLLDLDATPAPIAPDRAAFTAGLARPEPSDLAYVIYTSGSTGTPKGVAVTHRSLWQHNVALGAAFALGPADRVLQFSALSFDASLEEIFPTWAHGATLVLRDERAVQSLAACTDYVAAERITVLDLPTAFWRELADHLPVQPLPPAVRLVVTGGEKATLAHLQRWQRQVGPSVRLLNTYGPTEATIVATVFDATGYDGHPISGGVPIGRPIAGTRAYVLDQYGRPVPIGIRGELHLGGAGVARGYLGRPELTAEKFVPDPFAGQPGARMYRTGDFARWLPDGNLEFLGRADAQVKWRGFRIELGEIENALRQQPGVNDAVAAVREDQPGLPRLVGYVVGASPPPEPRTLLSNLRATLPAFLVPGDLVLLDSFPLTPAGKVDHAALPAPAVSAAPAVTDAFSPVEERLRAVWEEVLGVPIRSPEANFFELGGHSLVAVRLFARIESAFGIRPPLVELFAHPTLRQLAAAIARPAIAASTPPGIVTLKQQGQAPPLFCIHGAGGGMLWGYANLAAHATGDHPICALEPETGLNPADPGALEEMAARYVARIRAVQPHGPYHLAGYCFAGNVAYEMARQLARDGESIGLLAVFDSTPSNSEYYRVRLNRQFLVGFGRNLWLAFEELAALPAGERAGRLRFFARRIRGRIFRQWIRRPAGAEAPLRIEDDIEAVVPDRSLYTEAELRLWQAHLRMLERYHPQPAPLRLVLFRTRRRPLWRSHEPTLGWGTLALAGVDLQTVPGSHGSLFREPDVAILARKVSAQLASLRRGEVDATAPSAAAGSAIQRPA